MNLKQSYEFLRLVVEGDIETWEARDRASGKRVLVHLLLAGETAANKANVERISDLCKQNHELIAVGLDAEIPFVVTGTAFGSVGLREWNHMAEAAAMPTQVWHRPPPASLGNLPPPPQSRQTAEPEKTFSSDAGEFTRIFQAQPPRPVKQPDVKAPPAGISPQPESSNASLPHAPVSAHEPGEFTRVFQKSPQTSPMAQPPERPLFDEKRNRPGAASQPGEFTRFFQSPYRSQPSGKAVPGQVGKSEESDDLFKRQPSPVIPNLAARPPVSPAGSEFTQMFQRSAAALPTDPELRSFTGILGAPTQPVPPLPAAPVAPEAEPSVPQAAGDFTRIFSPSARAIPDALPKPQEKMEPSRLPVPPHAAGPLFNPPSESVASQSAAEAGDYTRVLRSAQVPKLQPPPVQVAKPEIPAKVALPKAKRPATQLPILAVLLGLLLLAILVVIFFAIRR